MLREQEKLSLKDHMNHEVVQDKEFSKAKVIHITSVASHKCNEQMLIFCNEKSPHSIEQFNHLMILYVWCSCVSRNKHREHVHSCTNGDLV